MYKKIYVDKIFNIIIETRKNDNVNSFEINLDENIKMKVKYENNYYITFYDSSIIIFLKKIKVTYKNKKCYIYNNKMLESYITDIFDIDDVKKIEFRDKNTKSIIKYGDLFSSKFNNYILDIKDPKANFEETFIPKKFNFNFESDNIKFLDLTDNYEYYLEGNANNLFFENSEKKKFLEDLNEFVDSNENYKYILGPSGIGKTLNLLKFRYDRRQDIVFYLNLKGFNNMANISNIINYIKNELSFCFDTESNFKDFFNLLITQLDISTQNNNFNKYFNNIHKNEFIFKKKNLLFEIISNIVNNYEIISKGYGKFIIILDQYKLSYDRNGQIDYLLKNIESNNNRFKYLKCSSMKDMDGINQINSFIEKKSSIIFCKNLGFFQFDKKERKKNEILSEFGNLPKYYQGLSSLNNDKDIKTYYEKIKNNLTNKIKESINILIENTNINFTTIYKSIIKNENKILDIKEFKKISKHIPFKYFLIHKEGINFKFNYLFPLIENIFNELEIIEEEQISKNYMEMANGENSELAWPFERLVNHYFKIGQKPFEDLDLKIDKSIKLNQILNLKDIYIEKEFNVDEDNENNLMLKTEEEKNKFVKSLISENNITLLKQNNNDEHYDGALLIPNMNNKNDNFFYMLLYQITLEKTKINFVTRTNIIKDIAKIQKLYYKAFGIKIQKFYFMYILDYNRKGLTYVEKLSNSIQNDLYYSYYDINNKKLLNKISKKLNWKLIKKECKINKYLNILMENNKQIKQMINTIENTSKKFLHQKRFLTQKIEYNYDNNSNNNDYEINYYFEIKNKNQKIKIQNYGNKKEEYNISNEIETNNNFMKNENKKEKINEIKDNIANKNEFDEYEEIITLQKLNKKESEYFIDNNKSIELKKEISDKIKLKLKLNDDNLINVILREPLLYFHIKNFKNSCIIYYNINNEKEIILVYYNDSKNPEFFNLILNRDLNVDEKYTFINNQILDFNGFFKNYSSYLISF